LIVDAIKWAAVSTPLDPELLACTPVPVVTTGFNPSAILPFGLTTAHLASAMTDFLAFLKHINTRLHDEKIQRLETIMMAANFSSLVGEFMNARIPEHCKTLVKNKYHNGHPDLIPVGTYPGDSVQHASVGIEIKASRYDKRWQGHNAEDTWLMVFIYASNRPRDGELNPRPFQFLGVAGAELVKADWLFAGRSATSRRTITASVTKAGYAKMIANWIYKDPTV
jgi:hypothetical protein